MKITTNANSNYNCKKLFESAEESVTEVIQKNIASLDKSAKKLSRISIRNIFGNFFSSIVLVALIIFATIYAYNFRDGTKIAEAKAAEALAEEKERIGNEAVEAYKKSSEYGEDACKFVAENISYIECGYYLYKYMRSNDIKKYPQIENFYKNYLKEGYKQYKEKKKE